jgi:hypothetical protein
VVCSVSPAPPTWSMPTDTPGKSDLAPSESAYASSNGDATEAQVIIHGTLDDFAKKEFALINTSIESAYNEAYTKAGYSYNCHRHAHWLQVVLQC